MNHPQESDSMSTEFDWGLADEMVKAFLALDEEDEVGPEVESAARPFLQSHNDDQAPLQQDAQQVIWVAQSTPPTVSHQMAASQQEALPPPQMHAHQHFPSHPPLPPPPPPPMHQDQFRSQQVQQQQAQLHPSGSPSSKNCLAAVPQGYNYFPNNSSNCADGIVVSTDNNAGIRGERRGKWRNKFAWEIIDKVEAQRGSKRQMTAPSSHTSMVGKEPIPQPKTIKHRSSSDGEGARQEVVGPGGNITMTYVLDGKVIVSFFRRSPDSSDRTPTGRKRQMSSPVWPKWLPDDWYIWKVERERGESTGQYDSYYYHPQQRGMFRSKTDVLYFINHGKRKPGTRRDRATSSAVVPSNPPASAAADSISYSHSDVAAAAAGSNSSSHSDVAAAAAAADVAETSSSSHLDAAPPASVDDAGVPSLQDFMLEFCDLGIDLTGEI